MTMSINMGSINNNASNSNIAYYNPSEYNGQYYAHDTMSYNNIQDPYTYQHNQYNHNTQYNYHHHHHHHPSTNKMKNDQLLKKFNQFFHNDLTDANSEPTNDNIVTVCNGLSYTNLDYHYNEHLIRKHQYETSCQQYQKHDRFHEYYSDSQDKREHFSENSHHRLQEHPETKENYVGYDIIHKEPLHTLEHEPTCSLPHRTAEHFMHNSEHFEENVSTDLNSKVHFHENGLHTKSNFQHIEPHVHNQSEEDPSVFEGTSKSDEHFSRRSIIKERPHCSKLTDKTCANDKCEEFIQYDRGGDYFSHNFSETVTKPKDKTPEIADKVSEKPVKSQHYASLMTPPVQDYCHEYSNDYYNDINIKEEDYELGNYYQSDYYSQGNHGVTAQAHHQDQHNMLSCDSVTNRSSTESGSNAGSSKTMVPTYKWMQVKRNVPKPQGKTKSDISKLKFKLWSTVC